MKANKTKPTRKAAPKKAAPKAPRRKASPALRLLTLLVAALDSKKAEQLRVLQVGKLSSITDYLVLATGTSDPHLRALRIEAERVLDGEKTKILGVETTQGSGWIVIDAFDVMVHLFTPENRGKYRMEQLWKDAEEVSIDSLLKSREC
jgi:ribosome-associated protein